MAIQKEKFIPIELFIDEYKRISSIRAEQKKFTSLGTFYNVYYKNKSSNTLNDYSNRLSDSSKAVIDAKLLQEYLLENYEKNNEYRLFLAASLYRIITGSGFILSDQYNPSDRDIF